MDRRVEADATPAEEWEASLNATCNRLSTQYLSLLRAASSVSALEGMGGRQDPRSGGGEMKTVKEPPPPLAADAELSSLQAQLAVQNLSVASAHLLDLIRTLRISILLMDEDTVVAEERLQCMEAQRITAEAEKKAAELEAQLLSLRNDVS